MATIKKKHPHARGEDFLPKFSKILSVETPPRTWGRLFLTMPRNEIRGNTPTHVGKTSREAVRLADEGKHPHARGEDSGSTLIFSRKKETPPRTWGRPISGESGRAVRRNTPTHVGKTHFR